MTNSKVAKPVPQSVVSTAPESSEVTVYTGGPAIVRELRAVELPEGKVLVSLDGLPEQYVPSSLTITKVEGPGNLKLGAFGYRPANLSLETILQKALGTKVTIQRQGDAGKKFAGTLKYVLNGQLVLDVDGQVQVVNFGDDVSLDPVCLQGLTTLASLELEPTSEKPGAYNIGIMYATEGLAWAQRFEVFYDAKAEKLTRFACWVDLTNNTGAPLSSRRYQLIAGYNNGFGHAPRPRGMRMMAAAPMNGGGLALEAASFSADAAEVETVGEQKLYTLPTEIAIVAGETKTTALILAENVPITPEYILAATGYAEKKHIKRDSNKLPVNVRLKLRNDKASNLGVALPPGQVNVFEPDSKGSLQRTDSSQVTAHLAEGESFELMLNTPSKEIKAQRVMTYKDDPLPEPKADVKPLGGPEVGTVAGAAQVRQAVVEEPKVVIPRFRVENRELTVFNYKDREVDVVVEDGIPHEAEFVKPIGGAAVKSVVAAARSSSFVVTVPAGGETKVKYTIKYRIN